MDVKIKVSDNGPYLVEGPINLCDGEGRALASVNRKVIALCRCGHSANKPFCDGAHAKVDFNSKVRGD
jgi:CDGSH-type Zn-finger protein